MTKLYALIATVLSLFLYGDATSAAEVVLVPPNAVWRYLDNGSNQGTAWRSTAFNDSTWKSGAAELGYGDSDETTIVSYGPNASAKYITTYFRHSFFVPNAALYTGLSLNLLKDDGAVVYLNGQEVHRVNMPSGSISYTTAASSALGAPQESTFNSTFLSNTLLTGTNVIAVEVHQANGTSTDLSFVLELKASDSVSVTRGPYLQIGTPSSMILKWRTSSPTDSRVRYGLDPFSLTSFKDNSTVTTEHEVELTGLLSNTQYYYSIGSTTTVFAGEDANHFFYTSPPSGVAQPTRIWVLGDSGTANANAAAVRDAYMNLTGSQYTDLWLMLGDNAYATGTDSEYQSAVFNMYPDMLRTSPLWPTLGNHDGASADSATQTGPYYNIFKLPTQGQAGGLASGTEAYYSFDFGSIHFICLESHETNRAVNGTMMTWLQNDVNSTNKDWIIAFWHHPPYSKGSHNSDTESQLIEMRQNALPILEQAGVDLVLTGHSHSYERSFLIDGHYGNSGTFTSSMKKDGGSGRVDSTGAYKKPTDGLGPHEGAVYAVAGSSGQVSGGTLNHPAMFISLNSLGSMILQVNGSRLDAQFIDQNGTTRDYFTILKGATVALPAPTNLTATAVSASQINLTWVDHSTNETGFKIERSTDNVNFSQIATVGTNIQSYSNTGLTASTRYFYRVRATNANGDSAYSNTADATTQGTVALNAPSGLTAVAVAKNRINLAWTDNSTNESGFKIERSTNGTSFTQIATVAANVKTYASTGLKGNRIYYYRVRAYNASGNSAYSNVASATTPRR
jgi:acid phosphatase type 7